MEKVEDIQAKDLNRIISSRISVFVEFWTKSCGNCKKFKPVYEKLSTVFSDLRFTRINIFESIENLRLAESFGIEQTPTIIIFRDSKRIGQIVGYNTFETAVEKIRKIIE